MKNFLVIIFSVSALLFISGCIPSKILSEEQTEKVFEHNVEFKKEDIKQKLLLFVNEKFISGKSVTQTSEDGLFTGNGIVEIDQHSVNSIKMEVTFLVKYDDNHYKVKWIVKDISSNAGSIARNLWGYYAEEVEGSIKNNDDEMFNYLTSAETF